MILLELYNFLYKDIISGLEAPGSTRKLYKNPTDGVQVQGQKGESMKALVLHLYCLRLKEIKKKYCLDDIGWTIYKVFQSSYSLSQIAVSSRT